MINANGILSVLDRGVTINWDDGPTAHKITAQVRYHTPESATAQLLRVSASQRYSDDPLTFAGSDTLVRAAWCWREIGHGWSAQLSISNESESDLYVDSLEVARIDNSFGGVFNLGAPPGLWQCARESAGDELAWEAWAESAHSAAGFMRTGELLIQPSVSNRTRPPSVLFRFNPETVFMPTEIRLECTGERFERLVARGRADGTLLGSQAVLTSAELWIAAGDDAQELRQWGSRTQA